MTHGFSLQLFNNILLKLKTLLKLLLISLLLISTPLLSSPTFTTVTENLPPFQEIKNNVIQGETTAIVKKTLKCANIKSEFLMLPWNRAYDTALNNANTLIYSMARTLERENKFLWIGPLQQTSVNLYKLKSRKDIQIQTFEDIRNYRLGLLRGGFIVKLFTNANFTEGKDFTLNDNNESRLRMLFAGRYDLIDALDIQMLKLLEKTQHNMDELEVVMPLVNDETLYLAINRKANPQLVKILQTCIKKFN